MKHRFLSIALVLFAAPLSAQLVVTDPINTSVNLGIKAAEAAHHLEILRQWAEQLEKLNRQLRTMEDQLETARRVKDFIGDPSAASSQMILYRLGATDLARTYGDTLQSIRRLSYVVDSLKNTADGIFEKLDDLTSNRSSFTRQEKYYRRFAAVETQAAQFETVQQETDERTAALQRELSSTLEQVKAAVTQAVVDKLAVKVAALNGQLAETASRRQLAAEQLRAQATLVDNQTAKERQDLLERQMAEERQSLATANAWQSAIKVTPTTYR